MAKTNTKKTVIDTVLLASIVTATQNNAFVYVPAKLSAPLLAAELVEVNAAMVDTEGSSATRATQKGIEYMTTQTHAAPAVKPDAVAAAAPTPVRFSIEKNVEIPTSKRGPRAVSVYPFDDMEINDSFFIPATAEKPNPAKQLASTVSSAQRRYATQSTTETVTTRKGNVVPKLHYTRTFVLRAVPGGARVWRTA